MVEIQRWKQAYMTTNVPVLVPANATIQLADVDSALVTAD